MSMYNVSNDRVCRDEIHRICCFCLSRFSNILIITKEWPTFKAQQEWERGLFNKTHRANGICSSQKLPLPSIVPSSRVFFFFFALSPLLSRSMTSNRRNNHARQRCFSLSSTLFKISSWLHALMLYAQNIADVFFYVNGNAEENELVLSSVLSALYETISLLLRYESSFSVLLCFSLFFFFFCMKPSFILFLYCRRLTPLISLFFY